MIVRRAAVAVVAVLGLAGCGGTSAGAGTAVTSAATTPSQTPSAPLTTPSTPSTPSAEPETDLYPPDEPTSVPGPSAAKASVSLYAGIDKADVVHLGGRVASTAQLRALRRAASGSGRTVDAAALAVVPRATTAKVGRAVTAVGEFLAVAPGGHGTLKLWLTDTTALAQVRPTAGGFFKRPSDLPEAAVLKAGGVDLVPSQAMQVRGKELSGIIHDSLDGQYTTFPQGSARLTATTRHQLAFFAGWAAGRFAGSEQMRGLRLFVTGHARPDESNRQALGLQRARAVRAYLVAHGVAAERVAVLGYAAHQNGDGFSYFPGDGVAGRYEIYVVG